MGYKQEVLAVALLVAFLYFYLNSEGVFTTLGRLK